MTVQELIKLMSESKNKQLRNEQAKELIKKKLEVKEYISIKAKKDLIDSIVNECIIYDEGVFKFDDIEKYVCFTMKTIEAYTNLELSDDLEADYDLLCESKLLNQVIDTFNGEYENVKILLEMKCDYILSSNSVEVQVGRFLDNMLEKVDGITNVLSSKLDDFNFDKLPISRDNLEKLLDFVNKNK